MLKKLNLRQLHKVTFILFAFFLIFSCARKNDNSSSLYIVGPNGEKHKVQTRVPELNARILEAQGYQIEQKKITQSSQNNQQPESINSKNLDQQISDQQKPSPINNSFEANSQNLQNTAQIDQEKPAYNLPKNDSVQAEKNNQSSNKTSAGVLLEQQQEIQFDLAEPEKPVKKSRKKMRLKAGESPQIKSENVSSNKGIFVQTGSFSLEENAKQDLLAVQKFYKGRVEQVEISERKVYRVLLGPFSNSKKARNMVNKIKSSGHEAILVKNR